VTGGDDGSGATGFDPRAGLTELFLRAVEMEPVARESFLDDACRGDPERRRQVDQLLAHDGSTDLLRSRVSAAPSMPERVGPYRVCGLIGGGGMGEVYRAQQDEPIARTVAIKVVRPALTSDRVLARFEFERLALARMDHPHIARILDAGSTADGAPYFVMECVDGVALGAYCDERSLGIEARLDLFLSVCRGVEHAHQRGVIHRDIKPSNVLVAEVDGRPVPKIIDFGIARAVGGEGATELGERPGTPGYMSPEQRAGGTKQIDTRTDVYSLGVLLYELLAGPSRTPGLDSGHASWVEPSRSLDTALPASREAAAERSTTVRGLRRRLRGDLDWIVWRATRPVPDDRYPSAAAIAQDVQRHLSRQPVEAHPARAGYRVGRFVRRHWAAVAGGAALVVALAGFSAASILQAARVRRERDAATAQRDRANESEARARRMLEYMTDMFTAVDPGVARGSPPTAEQMLDRGARSLDELEHDPLTRSWLAATIGRVYAQLGSFDRAEGLLTEAVAAQARLLPDDDPDRAQALRDLGALYLDRARYDEARPLLERSLALRRQAHGDTHGAVAQSLNELGRLAWEVGGYVEAERLYREALEAHERLGGPASYDVAIDLVNVSNLATRRGELAESRAMLERALAIFESAGLDGDLHLADCLNNLGIVLRRQGDPRSAIEHFERATAIRTGSLGSGHPEVAISLSNLGSVYWDLGDLARAREHLERALAIRERALPPDHPHLAFSINALAVVHKNLGETDRARGLFERGLEISRAKLGDAHPDVARILGNLGNLEREDGHPELARRHYDRARDIYRLALGPDDPEVARIDDAIGSLLVEGGQLAEGELRLARALEIRERVLGPEHPAVAETLTGLGECHRLAGQLERARSELERALAIAEATRGPDHLATSDTLHALGEVWSALGDGPRAVDCFERARAIREAQLGVAHPKTRDSRQRAAAARSG
jgi:tetratricopeptide (TPR) repeat protein